MNRESGSCGASVRNTDMVLSVVIALVMVVCGRPAYSADGKNIGDVQRQTAWLINSERVNAGVSQLGQNTGLNEIARKHSRLMRDEGFTAATPPDPSLNSPRQRYVAKTGSEPAEFSVLVSKQANTKIGPTAPQTILRGFLSNAGNKSQLLSDTVSMMGIGCIADDDSNLWTTVILAKAGESGPPDEAGASVKAAPKKPSSAVQPAPAGPAATTSASATAAAKAPEQPEAPAAQQPAGGGRGGVITRSVTLPEAPAAVARPVRTTIRRATIGPDTPLRVMIGVHQGDAVRWGVTTDREDVTLSVGCTIPGRQGQLVVAGDDIHDCRPVSVPRTGQSEMVVKSPERLQCRLIAVAGTFEAVRSYGHALTTPKSLKPGVVYQNSLGDAGSPIMYTFQMPDCAAGAIRVKMAETDSEPVCAIYRSSGKEIERTQIQAGGEWRFPLKQLKAGQYNVLITDLQARPASGDFQIMLEKDRGIK